MAVEFKVDHTRTSEYLILPKDIKFKPELNGRHELPDIEWLIESMVKMGQLQPVLVRNDGGTPILVAGFSRWRAAIEINKRKLTEVPFKLRCVNFKGSEQQAIIANISENRERNATTPLDDGYNIARLERRGMTLEEIAEQVYHEDVPWCRARLSLVSLSEESRTAMKNGLVKPNAAKVLAKLSEDEQARAVKTAQKTGQPITAASLKKEQPPKDKRKKENPQASLLPKDDATAEDIEDQRLRLHELILSISEGGEIPFEWEYDKDAKLFCAALLKSVSESA
jgi:ParB/RepB/Spo0J family partition protein